MVKKICLSILVLTLSLFNLHAQISIASSDMPVSGDTLRYSEADIGNDVLTEYQKTGENQTWNFGFLDPVSQDLYSYKAASQTPYGFFFFGSYGQLLYDTIGYGTYTITNVYNFFKNTSSKFEANGMGLTFNGIPIPAWYKDNDEIYQFPLTYERRDSTTFYFNVGLGGMLEYSTAGYRINEVDGWGSITTPYGTFDCIRVKTTIISADSVGIQTFKFGFPNQRMEYKWLAKNVKVPVLEITGNIVMGNFTPSSLRYRDVFRNIINPLAPLPDFEADNINPSTIDTVTLINLTSGVGVNYQWAITPYSFNYLNGTDSLSENPQIRFRKEGDYNVNLYASNFFGSANHAKTAYISVIKNTKNLPVADFDFDISVPNTNSQVQFTDQSILLATGTYQWSFAPATVTYVSGTNSSSKNPVVQFNNPNTYVVTLTVENIYGVDDISKNLLVVPTGIEEVNNSSLMVYPNPAVNNCVYIHISDQSFSDGVLMIKDVSGKTLMEYPLHQQLIFDSRIKLDLIFLPPGFYSVELNSKEKRYYSKLLLK